ncbi:hypothetical protein [Streptomyces cyaneofuscatus]|uniref:hypothetical protein n=1 Tax=Streptomyces cyaneofuscatus TaxID=66883 RepID=UPI0036DCD70C
MHEGSIPLKDFLDTMSRLQADFERRLGGIERKALPTPLTHAHTQERSSSSAWTPENGYGPLGIEAIWTASRESRGEDPSGPQSHSRSSTRPWDAPAD